MVYRSLKNLAFAFLVVMAMISMSIEARALSLRNNVVLTDDTIKLGDLFYGLDAETDKVLGPAPQPGSEMTLNARTLMRVAIAMDLPWRPSSSAEQVTITRAATVLSNDDIQDAIKTALKDEGLSGNFNVSPSGMWPRIILPQELPASVEVSSLQYDSGKDWFQATLVAPSQENPIHSTSISGRVEHLVDIPVLRENIKNGTVIGKYDIDYISINRQDVQHDTVLSEDELIGMTPRRMVLDGKPILTGELEPPRVISRGDIITMIFREGPLKLTAKARALEHGTKGDIIRVVNINSNKTIDALVRGDKEVEVQSF